jgi:HlyD family secretion protein
LNRNRWIIVAAVLVVVLAGVWWKSRSAGAAPKYRTAEVDRGSVESVVSATGTIRPVVQVAVGSQVSGTVDKLFADYNSRVRAGQVLLQLEQSSFRAREVQAEAAVARADASVKDAERSLARAQELFAKQYLSQAELDAAVVALELRKADLKQARAQLESAQVDLQHATIRAPIDGVVISRSIDLGQTVAASLSAPTLFVIANDLSRMQVETRIDEADIGQMRPGLPVVFTVDAFPDQEFDGQVAQVRLEPIVDQGVVTYTTVIHTGNPDGRLRPGMTANVTVKIEKREGVLRVPNAALRFRPAATAGAGGALAAGTSRGGAGASGGGEAQAAARSAMPDSARGRSANAMGGAGAGGAPAGARGMRGGARSSGGDPTPNLVRTGDAGGAARGLRRASEPGSVASDLTPAPVAPVYRPGAIFLLKDGKPTRTPVMTGLTDGAYTEVRSEQLNPGDQVIVGLELSSARGPALTPPPGMGGPQVRRPGGGR